MDSQLPQPRESASNSSQLVGAASNMTRIGTQQEGRHQFIHRDAASASTKHIIQDVHLKIISKTGSSNNKKQHAVACNFIHIKVNGIQLTIQRAVDVNRELHDQVIATCNGKPPWSFKAYICTVCDIIHHDTVIFGIIMDEFPNKHPHKWTKQILNTLEDANEAYMVAVIAESHC